MNLCGTNRLARWLLLGAAALESACGANAEVAPGDNSVWPANASAMKLDIEGSSFAGPWPAGSACLSGAASFTLAVATRSFAWHECKISQTDPGVYVDGQRVLAQSEFDGLLVKLRALGVSTREQCGADKPVASLGVTLPNAERDYLDDFYACQQRGVYVSGLDDVVVTSRDLAE